MARTASVPISAVPYLRLFRRLFVGAGEMGSIAAQKNVVWPEETIRARPPFAPPPNRQDNRSRAGLPPHQMKRKLPKRTPTTLSHGATIAYHIKDATLVDGCIYAKNLKYLIASKSLYKSKIQKVLRIKSAVLASSYLGSRFFGHWLADDVVATCWLKTLVQQYYAFAGRNMRINININKYSVKRGIR